VQFGGNLLVGVELKRQGFGDGKDLGQVRDLLVAKFLEDLLADELLGVLVDDILKILAGADDVGRENRVCSKPPGRSESAYRLLKAADVRTSPSNISTRQSQTWSAVRRHSILASSRRAEPPATGSPSCPTGTGCSYTVAGGLMELT